ncbi:MAG: 23S rRNA (adenine(2503)-C(2))-methyltransferase RlmN [Parcubacteria group bacterium]|nr:23S rRNA (adenine(2503)-C(2))-methyltransferase RlmN [Parcubacteria group bacterium]
MSRQQQFKNLFPNEPDFRWRQIEESLLQRDPRGWADITTLPKPMQIALQTHLPWVSYALAKLRASALKDTFKALLKLLDGKLIETVLMKNPRDSWTICMSSQVGCAMRCGFCATGKMGFERNLSDEEIIDQYRFWQYFLREHSELPQNITNIVFMGMGEPLANYDNVKQSIKTLLQYTDIGSTHITLSTVGLLPKMEQLLSDQEFPHVRVAISVHSADPSIRQSIVPTTIPDFFEKLTGWGKRYLKKYGNRRHHLTFEYVMLNNINDTLEDAKKLIKLINSIGKIKVNLIPYNFTGIRFQKSAPEKIREFMSYLKSHGVQCTLRKTMGDDISAACGQLAAKSNYDTPSQNTAHPSDHPDGVLSRRRFRV